MTLTERLQECARRGLTRARVGERWMPLAEVPRLVDTGDAQVELLARPRAVVLRLPGGLSVRLVADLDAKTESHVQRSARLLRHC